MSNGIRVIRLTLAEIDPAEMLEIVQQAQANGGSFKSLYFDPTISYASLTDNEKEQGKLGENEVAGLDKMLDLALELLRPRVSISQGYRCSDEV